MVKFKILFLLKGASLLPFATRTTVKVVAVRPVVSLMDTVGSAFRWSLPVVTGEVSSMDSVRLAFF